MRTISEKHKFETIRHPSKKMFPNDIIIHSRATQRTECQIPLNTEEYFRDESTEGMYLENVKEKQWYIFDSAICF